MIKTLKGLLTVAAKKDIRFYLNGIHVVRDSDGVVKLQASDGYAGMILENMQHMFNVAPDTDVILCRVSLDNAIKMFGPKATPPLSINNDGARLGEHAVTLIDGRYPDIRRALRIDSSGKCDEIGFDFEILATICKACSLVCHDYTYKCGIFKMRDASDPLLIRRELTDGGVLLAAVMPMRL